MSCSGECHGDFNDDGDDFNDGVTVSCFRILTQNLAKLRGRVINLILEMANFKILLTNFRY